ncbi:heterogeneous nuclear ribonucleoprotein L-like isoform X2 [Anneissia japonica]|uniref:heterogeneous nuclear ribonucleoprotein L-like isoform X1 n=1 Tax=Anneissia japonica TaxID=1529436 RepID=UPI00142553AC|nr:heterogeneous nuclear ribonucleoprotein L-like isoform X1 [Anneissia japonica]XP_033125949.1 heterogeneous nuclear ribonucleoprotein L-like isoform X2 [Anneissia japonica]
MMSNYDGHAAKRQRTDTGGRGVQSGDPFEESHKPGPSKVIHVRGLADNVTKNDLEEALQTFGPISYVYMIPRRGQALVEFEEFAGAKACVDFVNEHPENVVNVAGTPAFFNYSTSSKIKRPGDGVDASGGNNVLLFTILNPRYPITTDVLHSICKGYGEVLRIVVFKKNGVQAMVEFDTIPSATAALQNLNGCDVYSGCCSLRIDYARPKTLTVHKNDQETFDYTNPTLGAIASNPNRGSALLDDPPEPAYNGPSVRGRGRNEAMNPGGRGGYGMEPQMPAYGNGSRAGFQERGYPARGGGYPGDRGEYGQGYQDPYAMQPPSALTSAMTGGPVVMVYNMDPEKMNCERLFNLLCLYGNVVKIKFMKTKPGCAMAEMADALAVERAITNLSNIEFYGKTIQLGFSKQMYISPPPVVGDLPDGTPAFKDFSSSRNNRFSTVESAAKNRIQQPSKVLHFFNSHPESDIERVRQVFIAGGAVEPLNIKMFEAKNDRSRTGLAEFPDKSKAIEALIVCNHTPMDNPNGRFPYTFKLCFSNSMHAQ